MTARTYALVWIAFAVVAAILWMGGVMSLFIGVVFGFIAFGLVFTGMMCVLPGMYHPTHDLLEVATQAPVKRSAVASVPTYRAV